MDTSRAASPGPIAWRDRQGDIWTLGGDGLLHTPETAPFSRDRVDKKWGPLEPLFATVMKPEATA